MEANRSDTPEFRAEAVKLVLEQGLSLAELEADVRATA